MLRSHRIAVVLGVCMLVSSTILQKFALPGTGGDLPLSILFVPSIVLAGLITNVLEINRDAYLPFVALLGVGLCNFVASDGASVSLPSLALFAVIQSCFLFRFSAGVSVALRLHSFFRNTILTLALLGIAQFILQFAAGPNLAFYLDFHLPAGLIVRNFNILNPLAWNSPIYKSNGFFLLEPSFFCQLVAIGIALEILLWRDLFRLIVLALAALLSFSGTGLTMLVLFLPFYAFYKKQYGILLGACLLGAILFVAAEPLGLSAITVRVSEFGDNRSSGFARFLSPLFYLQDVLFRDPWAFFLGEGPGTVERTKLLSYFAADPTWAKLAYEYGFLGLIVYCRLFYLAFVKSRMPLKFPLGYTYIFLGGYLLNPSIVAQLATLVVWTAHDDLTQLTGSIRQRISPVGWIERGRVFMTRSPPDSTSPDL